MRIIISSSVAGSRENKTQQTLGILTESIREWRRRRWVPRSGNSQLLSCVDTSTQDLEYDLPCVSPYPLQSLPPLYIHSFFSLHFSPLPFPFRPTCHFFNFMFILLNIPHSFLPSSTFFLHHFTSPFFLPSLPSLSKPPRPYPLPPSRMKQP